MIKAGTRVRITAHGRFHGWAAIVVPRPARQGVWALVPGHPWQDIEPTQPWHFNDNEFVLA